MEILRKYVPPIWHWRRSSLEDIDEIQRLVNLPYTKQLFGNYNIPKLIEQSLISITQVNTQGTVISYIALENYPNVPALPQWRWVTWLQRKYNIDGATVFNSLFIRFLVWNKKYSNEFLTLLLSSIFISNPRIKLIMLLIPPHIKSCDIFDGVFICIYPEDSYSKSVQRILICPRERLIKKLKIRKAVEEDNDDLSPIVNRISSEYVDRYGEFYIAELIRYGGPKRQIVAAEKKSVAIGILVLNSDIDYHILNQNFELDCWNKLVIKEISDETEDKKFNEPQYALETEGSMISLVKLDESSFVSLISPMDIIYTKNSIFQKESLYGHETLKQHSYESVDDDDVVILTENLSWTVFEDTQVKDFEDVLIEPGDATNLSKRSDEEIHGQDRQNRIIKRPNDSERETSYYQTFSSSSIFDELLNVKENTFAIELFAMNENFDERLSVNFLEAAFEVFPQYDYCILTMPSKYPILPILGHFVRATPKDNKVFLHDLFIAYRHSILSEVIVRRASSIDDAPVLFMLRYMNMRQNIFESFKEALNDKTGYSHAYVMTCQQSVIGLAIVRFESNLEYWKVNYCLDLYINFKYYSQEDFGYIDYLLLSPQFHNHTRYFLSEIMRLSNYNCLLYSQLRYVEIKTNHFRILTNAKLKNHPLTFSSAIAELIPVIPRRHYNIKCEINDNCNNSLCYISRPLSSLQRIPVTTKIIIVGSSDLALSFLETLIYGKTSKYLLFYNVLLVSKWGLSINPSKTESKIFMLPYTGRYSQSYINRLNIHSWINIAAGTLTSINRKEKLIVVDEAIISYDYLILLCGHQFQPPSTLNASICNDAEMCLLTKPDVIVKKYGLPKNFFVINDVNDSCTAIRYVKKWKDHLKGLEDLSPNFINNIIVYGHCLEALCCINALLELEISGSYITYVEPFPLDKHPQVAFFNNPEIDEAVLRILKEHGIKIYFNYNLTGWDVLENKNNIMKIKFESRTKQIILKCDMIFFFANSNVCRETFDAINECSLVYNGGLIINPFFQTSDPYIFAAGPLTKYSRRYFAPELNHQYFSSFEIGHKLCKMLLELWDPTNNVLSPQLLEGRDEEMVPLFREPKIVFCKLPGGYEYLSVSEPGIVKPLESAMANPSFGIGLVTGDCRSAEGCFKLRLSQDNFVTQIVCFTKKNIHVENLICIYGLHEKLLNNLLKRFDMGNIKDFFEYFSEPWAQILYHDNFKKLKKQTNQILRTTFGENDKSIEEEVILEFIKSDYKMLSEEAVQRLRKIYFGSKAEKLIETAILEFIEDNHDMLPMYINYHNLKTLIGDRYFSPFHFK